jgi:putative cell wall-binding protein
MSVSPVMGMPTSTRPHHPQRLLAAIAVSILAITVALAAASPAHATGDVLHGYVTGADTNAGLANVSLMLVNTSTFTSATATSDVNGYYHFDTIPTDGNYYLTINQNPPIGGYVSEYYPSTPFSSQKTVFALTATSGLNIPIELALSGGIGGNITFSGATASTFINLFALKPDLSNWESIADTSTAAGGAWQLNNLAPGQYKVRFQDGDSPTVYATEFYNNVATLEDAQLVTVTAGAVTSGIDAQLGTKAPITVSRIGGSDRFKTSALVAATYDAASVVVVANGLGYPDALSAAAAAALYGGPLLLTQQNSLPAEVKAQIVRLHPQTIVVVGGTGVVSTTVFNELATLSDEIVRYAGANRYATSQAVFTSVWQDFGATTVYLADGRNYPDALASASAAGYYRGPVILVDGGTTSIPSWLGPVLSTASTGQIILAGGNAVLSSGIENTAKALPFMTVNRYYGTNRYGTSWEINNKAFFNPDTVFLAVGTGYADALSGAALAGSENAPLYLVPGNCVPQNVLDSIEYFGATRIVLLGGTGVLSPAVEALTSCAPTL